MKKYANWYILWLKVYAKRVSTWIQPLGMLLLLYMLSVMELPDGQNLRIGLVGAEGERVSRIIESLLEEESIFTFVLYENTEELKQDVLRGKLECGFLFQPDLEQMMQQGDCRRGITCFSTPFSLKGEVARETVYSQFFAIYSEEILKQQEGELFTGENQERTEELLRLKREYAEGDEVFGMEVLTVEAGEKKPEEEVPSVYPVRGMAGLLVFFFMLLAAGRKFNRQQTRVDRALNPRERFGFGLMEKLAAGTFPALTAWVLLEVLKEGRGSLKEGCALLVLVLFGGLWCQLVTGWFKKETSFVAGALVILLACLLVCPVWVDMGKVVPAVAYLRFIFPVGIYLWG